MIFKKIWKPVLHRAVTGQWKRFVMQAHDVPFPTKLSNPGLYLHVPFCKELCPFCPYNRIKYDEDLYNRYLQAVHSEIDLYASRIPSLEFISLYIGGGTPTINPRGICQLIDHFRSAFKISGDICIELHPSEMSNDCLAALKQAGVTMLSIGVETTNDEILGYIGRRHDGATAVDAVQRGVQAGFDSVNVDLMFALPAQTLSHLEQDLSAVLGSGVDQISTYPIFGFPYTELGEKLGIKAIKRPNEQTTSKMFELISTKAKQSGMKRCAVWSFIRPEKKKFSSITRHHYIGFGPSGASMTGDAFYVNTFSVKEYIDSLPGKRPIALSMPLTNRQEMAYWIYWRVYEMMISGNDFRALFQEDIDKVFGQVLFWPRMLGMIVKENDRYNIQEKSAYLIHKIQNEYSLNYINKLWGTCRVKSWPDEVIL